MTDDPSGPSNFIRHRIEADNASGRYGGRVVTRFPPEPNGYLHVGHAKAICINFGLAQEFGGTCNLRFDDTNPVKEDERFALAIQEDVRWLGFEWDKLRHASDYFDQLYDYAEALVEQGLAYVDSLSGDEMREYRGTLTEPGRDSPYRSRSVAENLDLLRGMRDGRYEEGEHVLRAKIDMASPNINMRDPVLYRIRDAHHARTGDKWKIYPMYDYAHGISDALEGVTHSLCSLEFEDHRPLYEWFLEQLDTPGDPVQIEFARLNLKYTITSKRKLLALIEAGHVKGWDDPRMPTLRGMRRRGYPPQALRDFIERVGVTKKETTVEFGVLENSVREYLNREAPRRLAVLHPLRVVITTYPKGDGEWLTLPNHPQRSELGERQVPFSREIYIEASDFMEDAPRKFFRLKPGGEVRLRGAFIIQCDEVIKDDDGKVVELRCSHDPDSRSGGPTSDRKVKGTIHWVSAAHAVRARARLYDRLFRVGRPDRADNYEDVLNPDSLVELDEVMVEPSLGDAPPESGWQFERTGYFVVDAKDSSENNLVFNRTITLRDSWAKLEKEEAAAEAAKR